MNKTASKWTPWRWIPTLYIAEGLPYFAVNTLTVLMYSNLGIGKTQMALFTGWLYLPWVIKPFWSPFVDIIKTKRWWILAMQLLLALTMAAVALFITTDCFLLTTLIAFGIMAFASATHDISADGFYILALNDDQQAAYVGVRSTFYRIASIAGQGGLVILAGCLEKKLQDVPVAWGITFAFLSLLFLAVFFYHLRFLPHPSADAAATNRNARQIVSEFVNTFITFIRKPAIVPALLFMLLYRLPEALCLKLVQPFLVDPVSAGGLGLSTAQVGVANGTAGVAALLAGGIAGGLAVAKGGLRKWIWPMALALTLPCGVYCWLAMAQPQSFTAISILIAIEQFGYGFGFSAYMLFLMYFSQGESATSHYAFCTAFMALGMMLPGMAAGWIFEQCASYTAFFFVVMATTLATFASTAAVCWKATAIIKK